MSEAANTCSLVTAWRIQKHAWIQGLHCKVLLGVNTCARKSWIVVQAWKASVKLLGTLECILAGRDVSRGQSKGQSWMSRLCSVATEGFPRKSMLSGEASLPSWGTVHSGWQLSHSAEGKVRSSQFSKMLSFYVTQFENAVLPFWNFQIFHPPFPSKSHTGEQYGDPLKTKRIATTWTSNPTPRHISRENQVSKVYTCSNVHCSTVYNSQPMETN